MVYLLAFFIQMRKEVKYHKGGISMENMIQIRAYS